MKNDWSEINAEFAALDSDIERVETLVWRMFLGVLGMVMTTLVMVGLNMVGK